MNKLLFLILFFICSLNVVIGQPIIFGHAQKSKIEKSDTSLPQENIQSINDDILQLQILYIDSLIYLQKKVRSLLLSIDRISFCDLNNYDPATAEKYLFLLKYGSIIDLGRVYSILGKNFDCFTKEQKDGILTGFRGHWQFNEYGYHSVVSKFRIVEEIQIVKAHVDYAVFDSMQSDFLRHEYYLPKYENKLKNWATLINLGDKESENQFINAVKDHHSFLKKLNKNPLQKYSYDLQNFYLDVLPITIGLLQSRKAFVETIYLMEEDFLFLWVDGEVKEHGYKETYIQFTLQPQLSNIGLNKCLNADKLDKTKINELKDLILNDPTIWKSYIRLE